MTNWIGRRALSVALPMLFVVIAGPSLAGEVSTNRAEWLSSLGGNLQCFSFEDQSLVGLLSLGATQVGPLVFTLQGSDPGFNQIQDFSAGCGPKDYCVNGSLQYTGEVGSMYPDVAVSIAFPSPVTAFGADWASTWSTDGLEVGFGDGPTAFSYEFADYLTTPPGTGFLGVIEAEEFTTIVLRYAGNNIYAQELFGMDDICWGDPLPPEITVTGPSSGTVGEELEFVATFRNCDAGPLDWTWTASGGGDVVSSGNRATVIWSAPGVEQVRARNTQCPGAVGTAAVVITEVVEEPPIQADDEILLSPTGRSVVTAADRFGNWAAIWVEDDAGESQLETRQAAGAGLFGQFFGKGDTAKGAPVPIVNSVEGLVDEPSVTVDDGERFGVGWQRGTPGGVDRVRARVFDEEGEPLTDEVAVVGSGAAPKDPRIAMGSSGEFVVTFVRDSLDEATGQIIAARFFNKEGSLLRSRVEVSGAGMVSKPDAAMAANGNVLIVWRQESEPGAETDGSSIRARFFDKNGNSLKGPFFIDVSAGGSTEGPSVAANDAGEMVVAWDEDSETANGLDVRVRRLSPAADKIGGTSRANVTAAGSQGNADVAVNSNGEFSVVWESKGVNEAANDSIFARFFDKNGLPVGNEFEVATEADGLRPEKPEVTIADDDTIRVTFEKESNTGPEGVYSRTFHVINECTEEIGVNVSVTRTLDSSCESNNRTGRFARYFVFSVTSTTQVLFELGSSAFDAYLYLLTGSGGDGTVVAQDDDSGGGNNARLQVVLSPGVYTVEVTSAATGGTGAFTLGIDQVSVPDPPPGPWMSTASIPGYGFKVRITSPQGDTISTQQDAACISETVCASGAVAGRSEVFLRVVGPKPNGFMWPTLVKFTTSQAEVWVEQEATGEQQYYLLAGASPGVDELPGLFDRTGFQPAGSTLASIDRSDEGEPGPALVERADPDPPSGPWLTTAEVPGFELKARITSPTGGVISTSKESNCISETLCVSGAVAGRSELFTRVVGPKPNGKLWPTLVKFSTSQVEIWIRQTATGQVNYYALDAASPGNDDLTGLFDRQGFDP